MLLQMFSCVSKIFQREFDLGYPTPPISLDFNTCPRKDHLHFNNFMNVGYHQPLFKVNTVPCSYHFHFVKNGAHLALAGKSPFCYPILPWIKNTICQSKECR